MGTAYPEQLINYHLMTFVIAEILILLPLTGWFFLKFKPAKHLIKQGECLRFIVSLADEYKRSAPIESGLVRVIMKTDRSFQRYNNLEELRNAALIRTGATMLAGIFPPLALLI